MAADFKLVVTSTTERVHTRVEELRATGAVASSSMADLTVSADMEWLREAVGSIDVLVNNAGMASLASPPQSSAVLDISSEDWERSLVVNLGTAINLTRAFLPGMTAQRYGRIINIASVTGSFVSYAGQTAARSCSSTAAQTSARDPPLRDMRRNHFRCD